MKKYSMLLILIMLLVPIVLGAITSSEIAGEVEGIKVAAIGILDVGFGVWVKANWWAFILILVGIGTIIVKITPNKKDDEWYGKYILKPVRFAGKFLSLDVKSKSVSKKK